MSVIKPTGLEIDFNKNQKKPKLLYFLGGLLTFLTILAGILLKIDVITNEVEKLYNHFSQKTHIDSTEVQKNKGSEMPSQISKPKEPKQISNSRVYTLTINGAKSGEKITILPEDGKKLVKKADSTGNVTFHFSNKVRVELYRKRNFIANFLVDKNMTYTILSP